LGYKLPVTIGSVIMCFGHFLLTFIGFDTKFVYLGLGLIATGSGLFKGNLVNLLGVCYKKNDPKREHGFTLLYVALNVGAFFATLLCGYVANLFGWDYGFGLAGIFMFIGTIVFFKFQYIFEDKGNPPCLEKIKNKIFLKLSYVNITFIGAAIVSTLFAVMLFFSDLFTSLLNMFCALMLMILGFIIHKSNSQERKNLIFLVILTSFFIFMYAIEIHIGSLLNLFTDRNVDKVIFGIAIPTATLQSLNPGFIIVFGPIIAGYFAKKEQPLLRFFIGLILMLLCFSILYIGCRTHDSAYQVHIVYLFLSVAMMSLMELYVAPLLFSLYSILSPKRIEGFMMGILMLGIAYASIFGGYVVKYLSVPNDTSTAADSLKIYQEGYLNIMYSYLALAIIFLTMLPWLKKLSKKTEHTPEKTAINIH